MTHELKTEFKLHEDTVLNMAIPDVKPDEVNDVKQMLETVIFKGCRFLFQKYDEAKHTYIADIKIMRKTTGGK